MNTGNNNLDSKYFSIGEAAELTGVKQSVLRFWEKEFPELKPIKNKFGHRVYYHKDIEIIMKIKNLLYEQGLTIKGAQHSFNEKPINRNFDVKILKRKLLDLLSLLKK